MEASHPARVRGLKVLLTLPVQPLLRLVAPRAGAWIERSMEMSLEMNTLRVAPRAGAWIESSCSRQ